VVILSGTMDEALSGRLPGLPGKSQFQIIAHTITNGVGEWSGRSWTASRIFTPGYESHPLPWTEC